MAGWIRVEYGTSRGPTQEGLRKGGGTAGDIDATSFSS
jgi:hypothetical protein